MIPLSISYWNASLGLSPTANLWWNACHYGATCLLLKLTFELRPHRMLTFSHITRGNTFYVQSIHPGLVATIESDVIRAL